MLPKKKSPKYKRTPCRPRKVILGLGKATRQTAGQTMTGDASTAKDRFRPIRPTPRQVGSPFFGNASEVEDRLARRAAAEPLRALIDNGGNFLNSLRLRKFRMIYLRLGAEDIRIRRSKHT